MQVPVRVLDAARLRVDPPVLIALASSTIVFIATPFLIVPIAEQFDVSAGAAGLISTAQLTGFVIASWTAGRFLRPVRRNFAAIGVLGIVANLGSVVAPSLTILAAWRLVSGLSLGLAAWFAWQAAFGNARRTGDTAVVGPLVGIVTPPAIATLVSLGDADLVFLVLAVVAGSPLLLIGRIPRADRLRPHATRHAATPAARWILLALTMVTMGGSAVFVYGAAIGEDEVGLSPGVISLLFSANALVSIPAAKWTRSHGPAGVWFAATSVLAFLLAAVHVQVVFAFTLVAWGFVFFMATPAAFSLLASRSVFPEERAGDAQAVMALGRVFGPAVGGALLAAGQPIAHGAVASGTMFSAALLLLVVERRTTAVSGPDAINR